MSWQTPEPETTPEPVSDDEMVLGQSYAVEFDPADAEDTTEDDATVLPEPAPSPYADPEIDTDGPQDETR